MPASMLHQKNSPSVRPCILYFPNNRPLSKLVVYMNSYSVGPVVSAGLHVPSHDEDTSGLGQGCGLI